MENNNNASTTTNVEVPVQVTIKDPKKVAQGKRLAESNCRMKEKLAQVAKDQNSKPKLSQAYTIGAVIAVGALGFLGYYMYQSSSLKGDNNTAKVTLVRSAEVQPQKRANKFEIELPNSSLPYYKMSNIDKKSIVNDLYQVTVISVFAIGHSMLGKRY